MTPMCVTCELAGAVVGVWGNCALCLLVGLLLGAGIVWVVRICGSGS